MKKEMKTETTTAMVTKTAIKTYMTTARMNISSLLSPTQLNQSTTIIKARRISREFNIEKLHARNR
ncbi:unnamed protein product [Brassica oleracea var. botrytis]|uniref:Uncharacterized protein n=3 Tax=Brassica TaxID=3705 RepID=A0A0D3DLI1_BRAOL|nr:unnamed protein product [Brassica napus]